MSNFLDVIKRNSATFYDYDTGRRHPIWKRYLVVLIAALVLIIFFQDVPEAMLQATLAVQSILIGFGFSVMFFLISGSIDAPSQNGSIEIGLKIAKLNELAKEIFYNVSYFNVTALVSVAVSLIILLPSIDINSISALIYSRDYFVSLSKYEFIQRANAVLNVIELCSAFILYFSLIDSLSPFVRIIGRVNFYFERRLQISQARDALNGVSKKP